MTIDFVFAILVRVHVAYPTWSWFLPVIWWTCIALVGVVHVKNYPRG